MVVLILLISLFFLSGCSGGNDGDVVGSGSPTTSNLLKQLSFTGNVFRSETRLISYSKKAGRVSIIDPALAQEIWGKEARGYSFAAALPDFSGAVLFSNNQLRIMNSRTEKSFMLENSYNHTAVADQVAAYSLSSVSGESFELVRSIGNGRWQQQTFSVPWGAVDPNISQPPEGQPILLVTYFNESGTVLTAFAPADGRYAVYQASSVNAEILEPTTWCNGDGIGTPQNATFLSLEWDKVYEVFYAGDRSGRVYAINPHAPCATNFTDHAVINLPDTKPVVDISYYSQNRIGVIQDDENSAGQLTVLVFDGSSFTVESASNYNICQYPESSMQLNTGYVVVMCTDQDDTLSPSKKLNLDPRQYVTINISTGEIVNQVVIDKEQSAGVAIDTSSNTLHRMLEGAFGTLEKTNLVTGQRSKTTGVLIKNILN